NERLEGYGDLAGGGQRLAQLALDGVLQPQQLAHVFFVGNGAVAAARLGFVERDVSPANDFQRIGVPQRGDDDADADADMRLVAAEGERLVDGFDQPGRKILYAARGVPAEADQG